MPDPLFPTGDIHSQRTWQTPVNLKRACSGFSGSHPHTQITDRVAMATAAAMMILPPPDNFRLLRPRPSCSHDEYYRRSPNPCHMCDMIIRGSLPQLYILILLFFCRFEKVSLAVVWGATLSEAAKRIQGCRIFGTGRGSNVPKPSVTYVRVPARVSFGMIS